MNGDVHFGGAKINARGGLVSPDGMRWAASQADGRQEALGSKRKKETSVHQTNNGRVPRMWIRGENKP